MNTKATGFTLIEVLIAIAIVAILASVAIPSYRNYVLRGKVPDATATLSSKRVKLEQYFQDNRKYTGSAILNTDNSSSQNFTFSGTAPNDTSYTLTATGKGSMAGFEYAIDQSGAKSSTVTGVSGWSGNASCWVTKQGGQC